MFRELIDARPADVGPVAAGDQPDPRPTPSWHRTGKQIYYVLFPTPNLDAAIDWRTDGPRYRDEVVRVLEARGYVGLRRRASRSSG